MKITSITIQARDKNRVNVSVDGKYRFSLGFYQLASLGIKVGAEYDEAELNTLEQESSFGKLYGRALEYNLMRPHSAKEVRDYLYRKTRPTRTKTGELKEGVSPESTTRVFERLTEKGYINDELFARHWIENRSLKKGVSKRKLSAELSIKGVDRTIIERLLDETERTDADELHKIILKKRSRYPDEQKLIAYLARLGFSYDDIRSAINMDE
ncbi:MAG: regulatory protein RecX [Candidatus Saccharibacteria bacterium]